MKHFTLLKTTLFLFILSFASQVSAAMPASGNDDIIYQYSFADGKGDFQIMDKTAVTDVWSHDDKHQQMTATAYVRKTKQRRVSESWLISPMVDLTKEKDCDLVFENVANFFASVKTAISVEVKEEGGEWQPATMDVYPSGNSWDKVSSKVSLKAYDGKKIQIAFVYKSTEQNCGKWGISTVKVMRMTAPSPSPAPAPAPAGQDTLYNFNANPWGLPVSDKDHKDEGNITAPIESRGFMLVCVSGKTKVRMFQSRKLQLRLYKGATLTLTAPKGKKIMGLQFDHGKKFDLSAEKGTLSGDAWTGMEESVTFTVNGSTYLNAILIPKPTGVRPVVALPANAKTGKVIYDLNGRRVSNPAKGIYIINGKKVYVK